LAVVLVLALVLVGEVVRMSTGLRIPGPPAYPFVGHIPMLTSEPWLKFANFAARYGPVYMLRIWYKPFVVLADPALVKQVFQDHKASYEKDQWSYEYMRSEGRGQGAGGGGASLPATRFPRAHRLSFPTHRWRCILSARTTPPCTNRHLLLDSALLFVAALAVAATVGCWCNMC
jgi:hypothetical protein